MDDRTRISYTFHQIYLSANPTPVDLPARGHCHEDHEEDEEAPTRTQQTHGRQHRHQARIG
jgi:hypothetical protein